MKVFLLALLTIVAFSSSSTEISCYHCISQVPLDLVQQDAKEAFKTLMFTKFNVPPSHPFCGDSEAFEFSSVTIEECAANDRCVKTTVKEIGFDFVMRGCVSSLYRPGYQLSSNVSCVPPAPTCVCDSPLCNTSAHSTFFFLILAFIIASRLN